MVIFGGAGDLARRKLLPALVNLRADGLLGDAFGVLATATRPLDDASYRNDMAQAVRGHLGGDLDAEAWSWLERRLHYERGDLTDDGLYDRLARRIDALDRELRTAGNVLFYLAIPPSLFAPTVARLAARGLFDESGGHFRRVIVEKPFGRDLESARALNRSLAACLAESQIWRIDHYLGKETVQNILAFRFANGIFEPIWNRRYVDHVQISVSETVGIGHRARYYEEAGALRDMVPNHLFQLLGYVALEPPVSFEADAVRDEKGKVFSAIVPIDPEDVLACTVRGQYGPGTMPDGERVPGYREEPGVDPQSSTETFVALRLAIDNWRWAGVPFYLRTGKRLAERASEIVVEFRRVPFMMFRSTPVDHLGPNRLTLRIQPSEGISLHFGAKVPGPALRLGGVDMDFCYRDHFGEEPATGYETLLYDALRGDATLFQRADNVEKAWAVVQPILDVWQALPPRDFPNYAAGSRGPAAADELLAREGRRWRTR
ncbi:MAG: glucose-6-phosphate dehydrogenase [Acidobacteria bacterium]|nr:MAG: glucose-6-phosphate dehydrogenase [Acidobacteriota bacterium]